MKTFELKDGKNHYGMMNRITGYDYHDKCYCPGTKSYIRTDNGKPIDGCICKTMYDLEKISWSMVKMEPQVSSPTEGFVRHTAHEEITYVISGKGHLEFPDGKRYELDTDKTFYLEKGQPHRVVNDSDEVLVLYVVYSCSLSAIERDIYKDGDPFNTECHCKYMSINDALQKIAPGFTGNAGDAGHYTAIIFEGEDICFLHPVMCGGNSSPMEDFVSHPGVDELECLVSGKLSVIMPDRTYTLTPDIVRYNPPEQPSKSWNNYEEDARLLVFYSTGKLANVYRTHKHAVVFEIQN